MVGNSKGPNKILSVWIISLTPKAHSMTQLSLSLCLCLCQSGLFENVESDSDSKNEMKQKGKLN